MALCLPRPPQWQTFQDWSLDAPSADGMCRRVWSMDVTAAGALPAAAAVGRLPRLKGGRALQREGCQD